MRIWYQSYVDEANGAAYWARLRAHLAAVAAPGTVVEIHGITPHDSHPHPLEEWRCGREMIANAIRAEREGYDAFIAGHFQDAGLYEAKAAVNIPVVGLGETAMLAACRLGQRIGLVTFKPAYAPWFRQQIARYGLERRVMAIHYAALDMALYAEALKGPEAAAPMHAQFRDLVRPAIAAGSEVLIPTGGGPMLLLAGIGPIDGVPVVDGTALALKTAEMDVQFKRQFGLGASRVADFALPPQEIADKFLNNPKGLQEFT